MKEELEERNEGIIIVACSSTVYQMLWKNGWINWYRLWGIVDEIVDIIKKIIIRSNTYSLFIFVEEWNVVRWRINWNKVSLFRKKMDRIVIDDHQFCEINKFKKIKDCPGVIE